MNPSKDHEPEKIRQDILEAASTRFNQFGYNKTTMAEIATDCQMSASNLYRFFDNKLDIGATLACQCLDNKIAILQAVVGQTDKNAASRLREFVMAMFDYTWSQWSEQQRMNELVSAICHERLDIVDIHVSKKQALVLTLIEQGNSSQEFQVEHPNEAAEAILSATALFDLPLMMPLYPRQEFARRVDQVVDLILKGLLKR